MKLHLSSADPRDQRVFARRDLQEGIECLQSPAAIALGPVRLTYVKEERRRTGYLVSALEERNSEGVVAVIERRDPRSEGGLCRACTLCSPCAPFDDERRLGYRRRFGIDRF